MTVVYLMRHSKGKLERENINISEPFQVTNEKYMLSVEGERLAFAYSKLKELHGLSMVVSSNYVRTMATAKYVAFNNKLPLMVDEDFNERVFGIDMKEDLPPDFFKKQVDNRDYKLKNGESFNEVKTRMLKGLIKVMKKNKGKKSLIVTHGSAITFLLSKWCDITYENNNYVIKYKGKVILNGFDSPDLLELKFNEKNKLINIRRITLNKENKKKQVLVMNNRGLKTSVIVSIIVLSILCLYLVYYYFVKDEIEDYSQDNDIIVEKLS